MTAPTALSTTVPAQRSPGGSVRAQLPPEGSGAPARTRGPLGRIADLRIGTRLAAGFGIVMVLLTVLLAVAVSALNTQVHAGAGSKQTQQASQEAQQARYLAADMNGWQTAYALDIALQGSRAAADTAPSRAAYLASVSALQAKLDELSRGQWDDSEKATFGTVRTQLAEFLDVDGQAIRSFRLDTPKGRAAGNALVLGREVELYKGLSAGLGTLSDLARTSAAADLAAAESAATSARTELLVLGLLALLLAAGLAVTCTRSVVRPLKKVSGVLGALAEGDLTRRADVTSRDEVGQMAAALATAQDSLRSTVEAISGNATALAAASEEMSATAGSIAASAEETSAQSGVVSAAAEQVSRNVQTVATGADEMGASIREISQNANEAARVGSTAVGAADATNAIIGRLGDSSRQIGDVVKVITSIAEQTNLLALNATIEAARAGEAGKGFAVVANEVKDLAQETAKATEDIGRRVLAIQSDTDGAVAAIAQISSVIARMNDFQTTIASAVEEQTATTSEMSRNVSEAALGSTQIAENIVGVATAAQSTSSGVQDTQTAAAELARMSNELQSLVSAFRY